MFWVAQAFFALSAVLNVIAIQRKDKTNILMLFAASTFCASLGFLCLSAISGTISCFAMSIFTAVIFFLDRRKKHSPIWLVVIFAFTIAVVDIFFSANALDIVPICASILYIIGITKEKERTIRILTFSNLLLFVIYDIYTSAFTATITDSLFAASTLVAIVRYDILKLKNKEKGDR